MKRLTLFLYVLLIVVLAVATLLDGHVLRLGVEGQAVYGSWLFVLLWAALSALLVAAMVRTRMWRRPALFLLHASFLVILAGAFATKLTSQRGVVHLRQGVPEDHFVLDDSGRQVQFPFTLRLDTFRIECYPATQSPSDYVSTVSLFDGSGAGQRELVSMNNVLQHRKFRFYQSSYDEDMQGSWLSVNYDPVGTPLTYAGYFLLFLSIILMLLSRREEFVRLFRNPLLRKGGLVVGLLFASSLSLQAARTLPAFNRERADSLALRQVVYNGRVAPFSTLAHDFLLKVYGRTSYHGLTPEQVVTGWLFSPDVWQNEEMILVKSKQLRQLLGIDGRYARMTDFYRNGRYVLQDYWQGGTSSTASDPLQKAIAETDERVSLIMMLMGGKLIEPLPRDGSVARLSEMRVRAEVLYNQTPISLTLFIVALTLGICSLARFLYLFVHRRTPSRLDRILFPSLLALTVLAALATFCLRWYVAGHVPLSNGFETMQFMALLLLFLALVLHRRFAVLLPLGLLMAGFALLVAYLSESNPQVTNLMPVLASPWLTLHVSVVMGGYALLSIVLLIGVLGLCLRSREEELMLLSRLMLYPAVFLLGAGIFLGAVWANQSWGSYWSWDPKEVWALITFMIYALLFHAASLPALRRPRTFHAASVLAFLAVVMTYFGVNFVLGGMHSYAGWG